MIEPVKGPGTCVRCGTKIQVKSNAYKEYYENMCAYCQMHMAKIAIERWKELVRTSTPIREIGCLKSMIAEYKAQCVAASDIIQYLEKKLQ